MRDAMELPALLVSLMRRKLQFVALLAVAFVAGLMLAEGVTATTVLVAMIAGFIVMLFAVLVWFWSAVFSGTGKKTEAR